MDRTTDQQAVLTIDLDALAANWRWLAARAAPAACGAAVKADAYGLGIEAAVPALARAGCRTFFVAHAHEGARARAVLRATGLADREARVFILAGFHPWLAEEALWAEAALQPVLGSPAEMADWAGRSGLGHLGAAIHVDTGMHRQGFDVDTALGFDAKTIADARAELLMSHFVSAELPDDPVNDRQIARFERLREGPLGALPASLANSSGILLPQRPHHDLVRPGYALYGGNPAPGAANPMRPVVSLHARISQLRDIAPGETAGYGGRWTAARPTTLATLGVGYADGLPRNAQSTGEPDGPVALVGGVRCPFVGRVSMDISLVDVTDAPREARKAGAAVELLGPSITVDDLGSACGTIGYEILTRLGRRYARRFVGASG